MGGERSVTTPDGTHCIYDIDRSRGSLGSVCRIDRVSLGE